MTERADAMYPRLQRAFAWWIRRRAVAVAAVVVVTGVLGAFASRVKPDYAVEHFFPVWSESREIYDRFKFDFPHEDAQALVIVADDDLFSPAGIDLIGRIEDELKPLPHVIEVEGPRSIRDIGGDLGAIELYDLFPADLDPNEIPGRARIATTDPIFAWNLASPDGRAVSIRVTLQADAAARDEARQEFYEATSAVVERHSSEVDHIVLSGIPAIRARFARMVQNDLETLLPIAFGVVLLLLLVAYRSVGAVLAGFVTILTSVVWSVGAMGLLGYQFTVLSSILPIVVMIISMSDTVHIVNDFFAQRRDGVERRAALAHAMAHAAMPCLATEVVISCGFLSLIAVNIVGVVQFGVAAAIGMMATWLANMTVLPLALSLTRGAPLGQAHAERPQAPHMVVWFGRFVDWIGAQTTRRPLRVVAIAAAVLAGAGIASTRVERLSYAFDDLRPDSEFYRELRFAENTHGGLVPIAIYVESESEDAENPMLEPEVVRFLDRAAVFLRSFPEIEQANSVADFVRKGYPIFAGVGQVPEPDGLPDNRPLNAQLVEFIDEDGMLADYLSYDRKTAVAFGLAKDVGSKRVAQMFEQIDAWLADNAGELSGVRVSSTGQLRIFHEVNDTLVEGLFVSFAGAVLATLIVFCIVLRSIPLGLIGIIPNVSPMVLAVAFMALAGITLRPSTVILFSIILVIADDDTIQYLARLRAQYARARLEDPKQDLHRAAALGAMRESGLPMFVTSTAVSSGFLLLAISELRGTADLGLLIGVTLFCAIFADLFLGPILVERFRPKLD